MRVLVQITRTTWSKKARGGHLATRRAAIPRQRVVNHHQLAACKTDLFIDAQHWGDNNDFKEPFINQTLCNNNSKYNFGCASVELLQNQAIVNYKWTASDVGAPERPRHREFVLQADHWIYMHWNGRFSCIDSGTWWYEEVAFNVASFQDHCNHRIFVDTQPDTHWEQIAKLW